MSAMRVAVAMSGGVDSSAAALILRDQGCEVIGFSMQLWDRRRNPDGAQAQAGRCCSIEDLHDARAVAARLGIPFYVLNFQQEFERTVVKGFIDGYLGGLTPSPCILCNSHLKFDHLVLAARRVKADRVATGHYARVRLDPSAGRHVLLKSRDRRRDQSYYLFGLTQEQLARAVFPLGGLLKQEARELARRRGLPVYDKPDSQEICFVPDGDYAGFIERHYAEVSGEGGAGDPFPAGDIVYSDGRVAGRHQGIHRYTIGQRRGLGFARGSPLYVVDIQPGANRIVVGERSELYRNACRVVRPNWVAMAEPAGPFQAAVRIRSRHEEAAAVITPREDGALDVAFDEPQPAVTPGQAAVFYRGEEVLGGGWIARAATAGTGTAARAEGDGHA